VCVTGGCYDLIFTDCDIWGCNGDGINSEGNGTYANGNQLCLQGCLIHTHQGAGITFCADTLNISGCLIENNQAYGVHLKTNAARAIRGVNIVGCHFENNVTAQIAITGTTGYGASAINIAGNVLAGDSGDGQVVILGDTDTVSRLNFCGSNHCATGTSYDVWENGALQDGRIVGAFGSDGYYEGSGNASVQYVNENGSISYRSGSTIGTYWGRSDVDGTWHMGPNAAGGNLAVYQRISGVLTRHTTFFPTYLEFPAPASAPSISANSRLSFYLDESGHNLKCRVKYADGTSKIATIAFD
jgi:hypothetical protein